MGQGLAYIVVVRSVRLGGLFRGQQRETYGIKATQLDLQFSLARTMRSSISALSSSQRSTYATTHEYCDAIEIHVTSTNAQSYTTPPLASKRPLSAPSPPGRRRCATHPPPDPQPATPAPTHRPGSLHRCHPRDRCDVAHTHASLRGSTRPLRRGNADGRRASPATGRQVGIRG